MPPLRSTAIFGESILSFFAFPPWNAFVVAKIGYPVPGEDAFYSNDNILTIGSDGFEEGITVSFQVAMFPDFSFFIEDADIHCFGRRPYSINSTTPMTASGH